MRYRNRMVLLYTTLVLVLSLAVGLMFYGYNMLRFRDSEQASLSFIAEDATRQFDASVRMMEFGIESLVYDINVVEALLECVRAGRNPNYPIAYHDNALSTLRARVYSDSFTDFYRVIIFNRFGDVIANRHHGRTSIALDANWENVSWLDEVEGTGGEMMLIGLHRDDWGRADAPIVYSYVKELQGDNLGYIEVQYEEDRLQEFINLPDSGVKLFLYYPDDALLYTTHPDEDLAARQAFALDRVEGRARESLGEITAAYRSTYTGVLALAVMPSSVLASQSSYIFGATLLVSLVFAAVSLAFVLLISRYLTRPIEQLTQVIESTDLDHIVQPIGALRSEYNNSIIEVDSLLDGYEGMIDRLSRAIDAEREANRYYMKAQFDTLQAQVNPHFLFNILNVISQRGMKTGDDTICDICANLAAILRYSTNTREPMATVEEEMTYLTQYAFLLKSRYQHMFDCETNMDEAVAALLIPRLTIQQIVENSINHGYGNIATPMVISVAARREGGASIIEVRDNGQGFAPDKIEELRLGFAQLRHCVEAGKKLPELEIGGMGLNGIYARLCLVFGDRFDMTIQNDRGARVTLRIMDAQ